MMKTGYQIFISYRRNRTDAHARVFYEKLREKGFSVFLDFESLFSGGFEENILAAVDGCTDFVLLLPRDGLDRCQDESDLLRKEIRKALEGGKNIVPVFVNGFVMPDKKDLPEDISKLTEAQGIECSMEYFNAVFDRLCRNLESIPRDNELYDVLQKVRARALSVKHDYFKKWTCMKLNEFLKENDDFFDGTNCTNPHAEDTFGVLGIQYTRKCLKAITAVSDYWQDPFAMAYLNKQAELIRNGIYISRVFVVDEDQEEAAAAQMRYQAGLGIDVYSIRRGNEYINPAWLEEDYLIQDDELLVEITCKSHKYATEEQKSERITTNTVDVQIKLERYQRIIERAEKFTGAGSSLPCKETKYADD